MTRGEPGTPRPRELEDDPERDLISGDRERRGDAKPSWEFLDLVPKLGGDLGLADSGLGGTEKGRGGTWILSLDPKKTTGRVSGLGCFGSRPSSFRASTMPRPIPTDSIFFFSQ